MAAYGDYGTGYIGTKIAYVQGDYETRLGVSHVAREVEEVLMDAIGRLLEPASRTGMKAKRTAMRMDGAGRQHVRRDAS
jgi:hypothetical protein